MGIQSLNTDRFIAIKQFVVGPRTVDRTRVGVRKVHHGQQARRRANTSNGQERRDMTRRGRGETQRAGMVGILLESSDVSVYHADAHGVRKERTGAIASSGAELRAIRVCRSRCWWWSSAGRTNSVGQDVTVILVNRPREGS